MTCFWIASPLFLTCRQLVLLRLCSCQFRAAHCATRVGRIILCFARRSNAVPELTHRTVPLPLTRGGLGLQSASRTHIAACWASWADGLAMVQKRHPNVAHLIIRFAAWLSAKGFCRALGLTSPHGQRSHKVPTHSIQRVMKIAQHHGPGGNGPQPPDPTRIAFPRCGPRSATPRKR